MDKNLQEDIKDIHNIIHQKQEYQKTKESMSIWKKGKGLIKEDPNDLRSEIQQKS